MPGMISKNEVYPPSFSGIADAVIYARKEAKSSERPVNIEVVDKATGKIKLRLNSDGSGNVNEVPGAV
jgi:hypothetical protein